MPQFMATTCIFYYFKAPICTSLSFSLVIRTTKSSRDGMRFGDENRVIKSKFGKNGKNKLFTFLVNPTQLLLQPQGFQLGEKVLDGVKIVWAQANEFILQHISS
jgi:hypothetical protein